MAIRTIPQVKSKFETGDTPTQNDFEDLIDTLASLPSLPTLVIVASV